MDGGGSSSWKIRQNTNRKGTITTTSECRTIKVLICNSIHMRYEDNTENTELREKKNITRENGTNGKILKSALF